MGNLLSARLVGELLEKASQTAKDRRGWISSGEDITFGRMDEITAR